MVERTGTELLAEINKQKIATGKNYAIVDGKKMAAEGQYIIDVPDYVPETYTGEITRDYLQQLTSQRNVLAELARTPFKEAGVIGFGAEDISGLQKAGVSDIAGAQEYIKTLPATRYDQTEFGKYFAAQQTAGKTPEQIKQEYATLQKEKFPERYPTAPTAAPPAPAGAAIQGEAQPPAAGVPAPTGGLEAIQATPIPPLPANFGAGSGMDQANWALAHREAIYNAYKDILGREPSAEEVNWQLTHNPDIEAIKQQMLSSPEYQQKKTATSAENQAVTTIDNITIPDETGQQKSISDVVKEFSEALGLDKITAEIQKVDDQFADDVMAVNENPWLSEAGRSKKIQLLSSKYESKKEALVERLKTENEVLAQAVDYWEKDREYKKDVLFKQLDLKNKELDRQIDMARIEAGQYKTTTINANNRQYLVTYDKQGNIVNSVDMGATSYKGSSGGVSASLKNEYGASYSSRLSEEIDNVYSGQYGTEGAREEALNILEQEFPNIEVWKDIYNRIPDGYEGRIKSKEKSGIPSWITQL